MASLGFSARGMRQALLAIVVLGLAAAVLPQAPAAAADPDAAFEFRQEGLPPLVDARTWVLQGEKLRDGACRYTYPAGPAVIPPDGWEMRAIAVDMDGCQKVMEEGTPLEPPSSEHNDGASISDQLPVVAAKSSGETIQAAAQSTKSAWQRSMWKDPIGVMMTNDATEITWTYDGSRVISGSTRGFFYHIPTWGLVSKSTTQGFFSGAFRGQTVSTWKSSVCPGTTVYTYYYYNRVWGHYNGTSTRAESSNSVNECLPFFPWVQAGYGTYPYA